MWDSGAAHTWNRLNNSGTHNHGLNEDAIRDGARVFSVYGLQGGGRVWVITKADRHVTTLLLPSEY